MTDQGFQRLIRVATRMVLVGSVAVASVLASSSPGAASVRSQVAYARGLVAFHDGLWEQAFRLFDDAVRADEGDALALYYRGLTQARRGEADAAIADLRSALRVEPRLPRAPLDLGIAYFDRGDYAQARRVLESAYDRGEERPTTAFFLGLSAYRLGEHRRASRLFEEAASDVGLRQAALYYGGLSSLRDGQAGVARERFRSAADVAPMTEIGRQAARFASASAPVAASLPDTDEDPVWTLDADVALQFDSNVVAGESDGSGPTSGEGDIGPVFALQGTFRLLDVAPGSLVGRARFSQSLHVDRSDFDLTVLQLRLDWQNRPGVWRYGGFLEYEFDGLDFGEFAQQVALGPWAAFHQSETTATQAYYRFRMRDYLDVPLDPFRDGLNNAFGVRQYWLLAGGRVLAHAGYQLDFETPDDVGDGDVFLDFGAQDFEYTGHQLDAFGSSDVELPYIGNVEVRGGYQLRLENFANANSRARAAGSGSGGKEREDTEHGIALEIRRAVPARAFGIERWAERLDVSFGIDGLVNSSNLPEFEHNRVITRLGVRAEF